MQPAPRRWSDLRPSGSPGAASERPGSDSSINRGTPSILHSSDRRWNIRQQRVLQGARAFGLYPCKRRGRFAVARAHREISRRPLMRPVARSDGLPEVRRDQPLRPVQGDLGSAAVSLLPTGIRDLHYKMSTVEGPPAAARTSARHALARRLRWPSAANVVALAQRLAREPLDGRRRALRDIAAAPCRARPRHGEPKAIRAYGRRHRLGERKRRRAA